MIKICKMRNNKYHPIKKLKVKNQLLKNYDFFYFIYLSRV